MRTLVVGKKPALLCFHAFHVQFKILLYKNLFKQTIKIASVKQFHYPEAQYFRGFALN